MVQCSTCNEQFPLPAQALPGTESLQITFAERRHTLTCKNRKRLKATVTLHRLPADGGWKTASKGSLRIALSSPPPQEQ